MIAVPPAAGSVTEDGKREYEHELVRCVRVAVWPPMVSVAVRAELVVFAAATTETKPVPVPDAPVATVAQLESLVAVQAQPLGARTP